MANRDIVVLNETTDSLEVAQTGDELNANKRLNVQDIKFPDGSVAITAAETATTTAALTSYAPAGNMVATDVQAAIDELDAGKATVGTITSNTQAGLDSLPVNTTGIDNVAVGSRAMFLSTTGSSNTAAGYDALSGNTTGADNTAIGKQALRGNGTGSFNTAIGKQALSSADASSNNAIGYQALFANTTGSNNTANGYQALLANTTGIFNTAVGASVMDSNTTGSSNTAVGLSALFTNTIGNFNTAVGRNALLFSTTSSNNTAVGYGALTFNTTGSTNTAVGREALKANTTGTSNTADGYNALLSTTTGASNTAAGFSALSANTTGASNTAFGAQTLNGCSTGSFNTAIGRDAGSAGSPFYVTTQSNRVIIGDNGVTNAYIKVAWTVTSDRRDKADIENFNHGLDYINALRPVTFKWDNRSDYKDGTPDGSKKGDSEQLGFIAQEVKEVEARLGIKHSAVVSDEDPEKLGLTETKIIPILVNAVQELSKENKELKEQLASIEERLEKAGL